MKNRQYNTSEKQAKNTSEKQIKHRTILISTKNEVTLKALKRWMIARYNGSQALHVGFFSVSVSNYIKYFECI